MNKYIEEKSIYFINNNELFFFTVDYENNNYIYSLPKTYKDQIIEELENIKDLFTNESFTQIKNLTSKILNIEISKINITHSISYEFPLNKPIEDLSCDGLYSNKDEFKIKNLVGENDEKLKYLNKFKNYTVFILNNKIVSLCFDNNNGSITIETATDHQKKGYSTKCLQKLTYILTTERVYPTIGFGTDFHNPSACRVAEKVGFEKISEGIWVRVIIDQNKLDEKYKNEAVRFR